MKLTKIALASVALMAVASQAQAASVRVSGATATSNNYMVALTGMCASSNVNVFKTNTSTNNLGNQFTIKCNSGNFSYNGEDTGVNEYQFDITGGSINSVLFTQEAVDNGEPLAANGNFLPATVSGCATVTGTGPLAFLGNKLRAGCSSSALQAGKSVGGFSDVEPAIFKATGVLTADYAADNGTFSQVFGVAASKELYEALQTQQGLTVGSTTPANQPSISVPKLASLMNSDNFNDAKAKGPKFLVPATAQTNITYCRRPQTSGTQASAQLYFMSNPVASGLLGGQLVIHGPDADGAANQVVAGQDAEGNPTGNTVTFKMNSGSSNVRSCLNAAGFAFGVLSAENNPLGGSDTYRFVKINGVSMTGGVAGDTQTTNAIAGDFDFVYEAAVFNPQATDALRLLNAAVRTGATSPGLFLNSTSEAPESKFGRGNNSVSPYIAR